MTLDECLDSYRWHLARGISNLEGALEDLWAETEQGAKPLGCWCTTATAGDGSPVVCHAQILAEMLRERYCAAPADAGGKDGDR